MQGLGNPGDGNAPAPQAQPPAVPAQPGQKPVDQRMAPGGAQPASEEQQAQYDKLVAMGMVMLFEPKFIARAREVIAGDGGAIEGVAEVAVGIVTRIVTQAIREKSEVDPQAVLHGGWVIINHVAEVAKHAAGVEMSEEDIETAFYLAADKFRSAMEKAGIVSGEDGRDAAIAQAREQVGDDQLRSAVERAQGARRAMPGGAA